MEYLQLFQLTFFSRPVVGFWVHVFFSLLFPSFLFNFIYMHHSLVCIVNGYIYDGWDSKDMLLAQLFEN